MRKVPCRSWASIFTLLLIASFSASPVLAQEKPEWHEFEEALAIADSTGKPIFVDVGAPWCGWCQKMKKDVYPELGETLIKKYIYTRLNRDDTISRINFRGRKLSPLTISRILGVQDIPAIVILSPYGEYVTHLSGYIKAEVLNPPLQAIASEVRK